MNPRIQRIYGKDIGILQSYIFITVSVPYALVLQADQLGLLDKEKLRKL